MNLPPAWYVIASEHELSPAKPNPIRRFGLDWVVWRNQEGEWILQSDRCPHRSAKLSLGRLEAGCLACPFHGFRFDSSGKCAYAPEIGRAAPGLSVETSQLTAFQGFLWTNLGVGAETPIPWFEDLPGTFAGSRHQVEWDQHFSRCIENQLDHSHLPFVHKSTIGGKQDPSRPAITEANSEGIRIVLGNEVTQESTDIRFFFSGIWRLKVHPKMMPFLAFVPIDSDHTLIYMRTYQSFIEVRGLSWVVGFILDLFNRVVLNQDRRVVLGQRPKNVLDASGERLFPSDSAIRVFRKWLSSSRETSASELGNSEAQQNR